MADKDLKVYRYRVVVKRQRGKPMIISDPIQGTAPEHLTNFDAIISLAYAYDRSKRANGDYATVQRLVEDEPELKRIDVYTGYPALIGSGAYLLAEPTEGRITQEIGEQLEKRWRDYCSYMIRFMSADDFSNWDRELTIYSCPDCGKNIIARKPTSSAQTTKGYWDSCSTCPYCGWSHFAKFFPNGVVQVEKM